jgi:hypothetical protein
VTWKAALLEITLGTNMRKEPLNEIAARIWKEDEVMQEKWMNAINWLRQYSSRGWVYDQKIDSSVKEQRSQGYAV